MDSSTLPKVGNLFKGLNESVNDALNDLAEGFKRTAEEDIAAGSTVQATDATLSALGELAPFINEYRDYLSRQRDLSLQGAENARRNAFQNIMGNANAAGMMYSNFPERTKIQYDTSTYMPARIKAQDTYQTGLDALRGNTVKMLNSLADYDDEIASLNKRYAKTASDGLPAGAYSLNESGDYLKRRLTDDGTNFFNSKGEPVRLGTTLRHSGITNTDGILEAAIYVLDENAGNWLKSIYNKARTNGYGNITINAGDDFSPNNLNFLNDSERAFMDSLGLNFAQ